MSTDLAKQNTNVLPVSEQIPTEVIEKLVLNGDLSGMNADQKVMYYNHICKSLGLNPLTQPFEIINLKGKLRMYAKKDATDQLRKIYRISIDEVNTQKMDTLYIVTIKGHDPSGRTDMATGVLDLKGLSGENLANALMKVETKAKRRFTLSICGLGILDETEVDSINSVASPSKVNTFTQIPIDILDPSKEEDIASFKEFSDILSNPSMPEEIKSGDKTINVESSLNKITEMFNAGSLHKEALVKYKDFYKKELDKVNPEQKSEFE